VLDERVGSHPHLCSCGFAIETGGIRKAFQSNQPITSPANRDIGGLIPQNGRVALARSFRRRVFEFRRIQFLLVAFDGDHAPDAVITILSGFQLISSA
jgi:hypothetical protein